MVSGGDEADFHWWIQEISWEGGTISRNSYYYHKHKFLPVSSSLPVLKESILLLFWGRHMTPRSATADAQAGEVDGPADGEHTTFDDIAWLG